MQLKNRKCLGTLGEHNIRTKSKPRILEVESPIDENQGSPQDKPKKSLITEVEGSGARVVASEPEYIIMREPPEGRPEFLVMEIKLPGVVSTSVGQSIVL